MAGENTKFGFCTLESDKYITVCETGQGQIAIVDLTAGNTISRQKMSAEAAIMNPLSKVVALRGESNLLSSLSYPPVMILISLSCHLSYSWASPADLQPRPAGEDEESLDASPCRLLAVDFTQCHRTGNRHDRLPLVHRRR